MATTPYPFVSGAVLTASQLNSTYNVPINAQTATYVLVAADGGKRVQMDAAGATTITVNTGLFAAGDSLFIQNIGAGTCTITAGTCTVSTASSLALAQFGGGTLYFTSASVAVFFSQQSATYGTATGGTSLTPWSVSSVNYNGLRFTADGTLTVTKEGLFDVLMFGGGSGGAGGLSTTTRSGGGGGASAKIVSTIFLPATTYSLVVGAGGPGGANGTSGNQGLISKLGSGLFVLSGGVGRGDVARSQESINFGTGGGGFGETGKTAGGATLLDSNYGFGGGTGVNNGGGGGGGGVGAVGSNAVTTTGGQGGLGFDVTDFNSNASLFKGGGGGGGGSTAGGLGGSSVGGAGSTLTGSAAAANTGSGGGGGQGNGDGGPGGSGVIFIRFKV